MCEKLFRMAVLGIFRRSCGVWTVGLEVSFPNSLRSQNVPRFQVPKLNANPKFSAKLKSATLSNFTAKPKITTNPESQRHFVHHNTNNKTTPKIDTPQWPAPNKPPRSAPGARVPFRGWEASRLGPSTPAAPSTSIVWSCSFPG